MNFHCALSWTIQLFAEEYKAWLSCLQIWLCLTLCWAIWLFSKRYIILCWVIWLLLSSLSYLILCELPAYASSLSFWLFAELFDSLFCRAILKFAELYCLLAGLTESSLSNTDSSLVLRWASKSWLSYKYDSAWLFAELYDSSLSDMILRRVIWLPHSLLSYLTLCELPVYASSLSFWLLAELVESLLSYTKFAELYWLLADLYWLFAELYWDYSELY